MHQLVWDPLCLVSELVTIAFDIDSPHHTVQLSRKSGVPWCFEFESKQQLVSFVSAVNGWYLGNRLNLRL